MVAVRRGNDEGWVPLYQRPPAHARALWSRAGQTWTIFQRACVESQRWYGHRARHPDSPEWVVAWQDRRLWRTVQDVAAVCVGRRHPVGRAQRRTRYALGLALGGRMLRQMITTHGVPMSDGAWAASPWMPQCGRPPSGKRRRGAPRRLILIQSPCVHTRPRRSVLAGRPV